MLSTLGMIITVKVVQYCGEYYLVLWGMPSGTAMEYNEGYGGEEKGAIKGCHQYFGVWSVLLRILVLWDIS